MAKRNFFKRSAQKRYKSQRFQNPYFKEEKKFPWKFLFLFLFLFLFAGFAIWFFLGCTIFDIRSSEVHGCEVISKQEFLTETNSYLEQGSYLFFKKRNKFLFNHEELEEHLASLYSFERLESNLEENQLILSVKERTSTLIWKTSDSWYLFDLGGVLVRYLSEEELLWLQNPSVKEGPLQVDDEGNEFAAIVQEADMTPEEIFQTYPIVEDLNQIEAEIGDQVLEAEEIDAIILFREKVEELGISVIQTQIDRLAGKWTGFVVEDGHLILFDTDGDIDEQAAHLSTILKESIDHTKVLEYIDVRFGDHLYFKYQD
jgi:hypothetical protein